MKIAIVFHSLSGHVYKMAQAVSEGVKDEGGEPFLCRVPETLSEDVLKKMKVWEFQKKMEHVPVCTVDDLLDAEAVIFGTPTRFGNMSAQMRTFLDRTGKLWSKRALVGKVGSVFVSTATQHGGQESTALSFHVTLMHHGMIVAGLPYIYGKQDVLTSVEGCSPYGASTIAGNRGERGPSETELGGARFQGRYVTLITKTLSRDRAAIIEKLTGDIE